ncbi:hypothetical protein BIW11_06063 [Tropilaelaps mercedesae]|uniref:Uncharacterized protein n=1 Tax=Tropilaelaps mercedesae TaxID=418985 RepID=A0A1V9XZS7_9ACAR|nr:hypothetical protein BIW11_06063 [Tropilaelaps mercedesae]
MDLFSAAAMKGQPCRRLRANVLQLSVAIVVAALIVIPVTARDRCPNAAPPEFATAFGNYLTKTGLRVSVVHLARSNAGDDEELYDHVCLETTARKVTDNQYRLSYAYKGIPGFINVSLYQEHQQIPRDEARFISVVPDGNFLAAVQCNPLEKIHVFFGLIKNSVGRSCATQLRLLLNRAHTISGFAAIKDSEKDLDQTLAQCCATRR